MGTTKFKIGDVIENPGGWQRRRIVDDGKFLTEYITYETSFKEGDKWTEYEVRECFRFIKPNTLYKWGKIIN